MKEIGSFIELEYPKGKEYYKGENVVRLNTGRAAIYHAVTAYGVDTVYLPYYQCETVKNFLEKKNVKIKFYSIDENFEPKIDANEKDTAIVFVNYYGIFGRKHFEKFIDKFNNVIIDNSQGFFNEPIENCLNIYSARKFVGVPDGAYVIGKPYLDGDEYDLDFSSDTALFMLQRIEYGCSGKAYQSREKNEDRIDSSDILKMSQLTYKILDGADYAVNKAKRKDNFALLHSILGKYNLLDIENLLDSEAIPMVYPFMVQREDLLSYMLKNKHFQGRWWRYILDICDENSQEYKLSKYMLPITIDQRYDEDDMTELSKIIIDFIEM